MFFRVLARNLQMVKNTIARHETPSLHTVFEMQSEKPG